MTMPLHTSDAAYRHSYYTPKSAQEMLVCCLVGCIAESVKDNAYTGLVILYAISTKCHTAGLLGQPIRLPFYSHSHWVCNVAAKKNVITQHW